MNQSDNLTAFYRVYLAWLNKGAPHTHPFHRDDGLCIAIFNMEFNKDIRTGDDLRRMRNEMSDQFQYIGLDDKYPFNRGDREEYLQESSTLQCHRNVGRIQWVKDHVPK